MGSRPHSLRVAERPRPSRTVTFGIFASQKNGKIVDERRLMLQAEDHTLEWAFTLSGAEVQGRKFIQNIDLAVSALAPKSDEEPTATESGLADALTKLTDLLEPRLLTDDEFKAAKARLRGG